jgi:hypothetical protein
MSEETNGGSESRSQRESFLERLSRGSESSPESASGDSDTGSDSNGSISGTRGEGSGGSERIAPGSDSISTEDRGSGREENQPVGSAPNEVGRDYSGRRGRHGRDCICIRCSNRRAGISPEETGSATESATHTQARKRVAQSSAPEFVDWGSLFPGMPEGKAPKIDDLFSLGYSTLFELVKLARKEEHWTLTQEEAKKLGKVTTGCVNTIPTVIKAKVEAKFNKYLPWVALVGFGMVITYPRINQSIANEKLRKRDRFPAPVPIRRQTEERVPVTGETFRESPGVPETTVRGDNVSSFPPGHGANFPPLDFVIP